MRKICCWIGLLLLSGVAGNGFGQVVVRPGALKDTSAESAMGVVNRFYQLIPAGLSWCATGERAADLRQALRNALDSAGFYGLQRNYYLPDALQWADSMVLAGKSGEQWPDWDRWYTEVALAFARDLYEGTGMEKRLSYDGVSRLYAVRDEAHLAEGLARVRSGIDLREWMNGLVPVSAEYNSMRDSLNAYQGKDAASQASDQPLREVSSRAARLGQAMNAYRWMHHFHFDRMVVVNIPSVELRYYTGDSLVLDMKVVAGQPSKRTPRFAAWCDGLVLYPYWNVPHKIAVKELLPVFKMSPALVGSMEMQIVDNRGRTVDPSKIVWASYKAGNFPYQIRQAPGCFNALGVIKFDINSPFDVYMHDTNMKGAFGSAYRYYSHGCIRLERPLDLGRALLQGRLDTTYLLSCFKDQHPLPVALDKAVPVFVIYNTVDVSPSGKLTWYKDIYHLGN